MSHQHLFGDIYFKYQLSQHDEVKQMLLAKYDVNSSEYDDKWNCNSTRISMSPNEMLPLVTPTLKEFGDEIRKSAKVFMDTCWINFYRPGAFQEIHNHVGHGCQLALVYFVNYNKETDGKFYFYNTNTQIVSNDLALLLSGGPLGSFGSVVYPDVDEGDVIMFPSYLHHGVSPHGGETLRVTVSCNLSFQLKGGPTATK